MDAAWALTPLSWDATTADGTVVVLPGALVPLILPVAGLEAPARGAVAAGSAPLTCERRVDWLLEAGREAAAWQTCAAERRPLTAHGELMSRLALWSAHARADLGLGAGQGPVQVLGPDPAGRVRAAGEHACATVTSLLAALPWPRWSGPVVLVVGADDPPGLDGGREIVTRPAAPLVRLRVVPADDEALQGMIAARLASLALGLSAPPPGGWPPWLRLGVPRVAELTALGKGVSPRAMHAIRSAAGSAAITAMLAEPVVGAVDAELAMAVSAPLLSPRRRDRLAPFLDRLRSGATSAEALFSAYALDSAALLRER
jgi:hypothetical protein